jgi:serine/threonine-protein kinase PpkA
MTTILIVEDDDAIRNNLVRLLNLEGFDTISAPDGHLGLERAITFKPDVIVSDVSMPGMSGFELLSAIRADNTLATTPFMLLTALDDRESMRRGMTGGADDYLSKPFTRDELLDAVNALVRKRGLAEEAIQVERVAGEERLRAAFAQSIGGGTAQALMANVQTSATSPLWPKSLAPAKWPNC